MRTESRNPYLQQAANLRLEAMHQRDRFGRDLLARELESAAATIEELEAEMEVRTHGEPAFNMVAWRPCGPCRISFDLAEVVPAYGQ